MKIILYLSVLFQTIAFVDGVYDFNVTTFDGTTHSLNEYEGKKIMITVLPSTQTTEDSSYLLRLDSVYNVYKDRIAMICVPSYEDNYTDDSAQGLDQWYRSILDSGILISKGVYTHKSSDNQDPLFAWLTHAEQNIHFDEEVNGPGEIYFINEQGELYGLFGPEARYSDKVLTIMIP